MPNELKLIIDSDIRGLQSGMQLAAKSVSGFSVTVNKVVDETIESALRLKNSFGDLGEITIDGSDVKAEIDQVVSKLQALKAKVPLTFTTEGLDKLNTELAEAKEQLNSIVGKSIKVDIDATKAIQQASTLQEKIRIVGATPLKFNTNQAVQAISTLQNKVVGLDKSFKSISGLKEISVAPLKKLEGGITVLQNQLVRLQKLASLPDLNFRQHERLNSLLERTQAELLRFQRGTDAARAGLSRLGQSTGQSIQVLGNFSRVIQDAPFGIIGIANNINPLVESFQRLQTSAKATGTSILSSLGQALSGPAGIGLGVGVVTSLLIQFGDKLGFATKSVSGLSLALGGLSSDLSRIKVNIEELEKSFAFIQSLEDIDIDIRFGTGSLEGGLKKLQTEFALGRDLQNRLISDVDKAFEIFRLSTKAVAENLSQAGREATAVFDTFLAIPEIVLSELSEADQKLIKFGQEAAKNLRDLQDKLNDTRERNTLAVKRIELQQLEIQKDALEKQKQLLKERLDALEKFQNETISKARQFVKEFGDAFVLPSLDDKFFISKDELFRASAKILANVKEATSRIGTLDPLKLKLPIQIDTEVKLNQEDLKKFLRDEIKFDDIRTQTVTIPVVPEFDFLPPPPGSGDLINKRIEELFFKGVQVEAQIPVEVAPSDITLAPAFTDKINQKLDLRKQFLSLGDLGLKEFTKIFKDIDTLNFSQLSKGIDEANKKLQDMVAIAGTLNQAVGQGLTNAFNAVFDAVLEGKNVFKALEQAVKELIVGTIKAIAQMLILRAVTSIFFPGAGAAGFVLPRGQFTLQANPGFGQGIGSRAFDNVLQVVVTGNIANDVIALSNQRGQQGQRR